MPNEQEATEVRLVHLQPRGASEHPQPKPQPAGSSGKLRDKVALVTGAESGVGRAVAVTFAKEGADVGVVYQHDHKEAQETARLVELAGRRCLLIGGDVGLEEICEQAVQEGVDEFERIDILGQILRRKRRLDIYCFD